jgi:hypothetical protein
MSRQGTRYNGGGGRKQVQFPKRGAVSECQTSYKAKILNSEYNATEHCGIENNLYVTSNIIISRKLDSWCTVEMKNANRILIGKLVVKMMYVGLCRRCENHFTPQKSTTLKGKMHSTDTRYCHVIE